jgi:hypothetical protein
MPLELLVWLSHQAGAASRALQFLKEREEPEALNAGVLIKDQDNQVYVFETGRADRQHGTLAGVIVGLLLALLGGPDSDGAAAYGESLGFPAELLAALRASLLPGGSALVMLAHCERQAEIRNLLAPFGGCVWRQPVPEGLASLAAAEVHT